MIAEARNAFIGVTAPYRLPAGWHRFSTLICSEVELRLARRQAFSELKKDPQSEVKGLLCACAGLK
jgi:hypothetical protein